MRTTHLFGTLLLGAMTFGCAVESGEEDVVLDESTEALTRQTYYVSALSPRTVENGWGPIELDRANGDLGANDGPPLTIRGKRYSKGLGVHAKSDVRVTLDGKCTSFRATIGVDDEVTVPTSTGGTVVFSVFADGVKLLESGQLDKTNAAMPINVDVTGKKELQLVVDSSDNRAWDHGDWASARVLCSSKPDPKSPQAIPPANGVADLFDPSVKQGTAIDSPAKLFSPGASRVGLSPLVFGSRYRTCNTVTGCPGWSSTTESWLSVPPKGSSGWSGDQSPRGALVGSADLEVKGSDVVAALVGTGSRGGRFAATNCRLNTSGGCSLNTYMTNCFWGADGRRQCSILPQELVYFSSVLVTSEYLLATSDTIRSTVDASGNYSEAEYAIYARVDPAEVPSISAAGGALSVRW